MKLIGIHRDPLYSPAQHGENDRMILELTADRLRRRGCRVELIQERQVGRVEIEHEVVFSMCQGPDAVNALVALEERGRLVVNSPLAARRCFRAEMLRVLGPHWNGVAPAMMVPTDPGARPDPALIRTGPCWVKRGDVHATEPGDVVRVESSGEFVAALDGMHGRGVGQALVQRHVEGTVVKFYGVLGNGFFRFYCERDRKVAPVAFWSARPLVERLVREVGLLVYGGDAVLTDQGQVAVIDINDWPSFACFREEAADAIAEAIYLRAAEHLGGRLSRRLVVGGFPDRSHG